MPSTIVGLMILIFGILPGLPSERIYNSFAPSDWREKDWEAISRVLFFSATGLILYSIVSTLSCLPDPIHVIPNSYSEESFDASILLPLSYSFLLHMFFSIITGFLSGLVSKLIFMISPTSIYYQSWDIFIKNINPKNNRVAEHFVVVETSDGNCYFGYIKLTNVSVPIDQRDIIIGNPEIFNETDSSWVKLDFESIYIPASKVISVGVVSNDGGIKEDIDDKKE